ncbi:unnamed protein product [Schistocephalus solidus]|uniref:Uncharacterized protein n=1 Tax=Schistocephalus solidus TaxID=70667 RepID=A0A183T8R9_SCHSO|nr:unnamed protein product [Schistocephalus solidus]
METLLATHTGTGGVIASLSNQFRSYIPPGTERGAGLEVVAADETTADDDDIMPSKHTLAPTSLHPSVLHQLTEVLSSPSKTHALYRKPSDGEELLKRLHSLQRHYDNHHPHRHPQQQQHQQGIPTNTHGSSVDATASAANSLNQRICLGKLFSQPASGTFQGSSLKPIDLSGTGTIREKKEEQHLPPHWLASRRLPRLPADMTLTSPAAAMLTYLHLIQQIHGPLGGPSGSSFLLGKPVEGPRVGSGTTTTQAPVVSTVATPIFASYRQLREDAARLAPTLATPTLMK